MVFLVGVHRLPRGRGGRHRLRRPRDRDQRPAAVTDAGPVARAAELAALGHRPPLDARDVDRLARARSPTTPTRACAPPRSARSCAARPATPLAAWPRARRRSRTGGAPPRRRARAGAARRPATVVAAALRRRCSTIADVTVVEAAAWALGELGDVAVDAGAVRATRRRRRATTATRSRAKPRSRRSARSATPTRCRRSSPRAATSPRCAAAPCSRSRRSTGPRSTPRSPPRSTTATGRCARPPRTSATRTRDRSDSGVVDRVDEQLLVAADVLGPLVAGPVAPVEAAGGVGVPVRRA